MSLILIMQGARSFAATFAANVVCSGRSSRVVLPVFFFRGQRIDHF